MRWWRSIRGGCGKFKSYTTDFWQIVVVQSARLDRMFRMFSQRFGTFSILYRAFNSKNTLQDQQMSDTPIKLFYSYSHKDEDLRDKLETHLKILQRQNVIEAWHDRNIDIGKEWKNAINENLETADIILLLISADFLASDYCWDIEVKRAMQRHEEKSAVVIPIKLRPCDTKNTAFMDLQGLPKDFKPVITWEHQDEAFTDIAKNIRAVAERIRNPK